MEGSDLKYSLKSNQTCNLYDISQTNYQKLFKDGFCHKPEKIKRHWNKQEKDILLRTINTKADISKESGIS